MKRARIAFNIEQERVLVAVANGHNVFMTGSAGTGKSMIIKAIVEELEAKGKRVAVTSSTGISAINIGGQTLHRWGKIGLGTDPVDVLARRTGIKKAWCKTDTLIIDEISMISKELFDTLDALAKKLRQNDKPFGGLQLVASGDFYQLSPVKGEYAFLSDKWAITFPLIVELKTIYRQTDPILTQGLAEIRYGRLSPEFVCQLQKDRDEFYARGRGILPTRLFALNRQVDEINQTELDKLESPRIEYVSEDTGHVSDDMFRIPLKQYFAIGAQVMCLVNVPGAYMNGSRGVITAIDDEITVTLMNGRLVLIKPHKFEYKIGKVVVATRTGIPLDLAWAISIHKSQGLSIDYLDVDLSRVFTAAQAYVAMSRATTMDGLRVVGLTQSKVYCDPTVLRVFPEISPHTSST